MPKKMRLDLADLRVESFAPVAAVRGEARAAAGPSRFYPMCTEVSCTLDFPDCRPLPPV